MNKKICVTSYRSLGCTFVEWSIHFLSGQSKYYNVELDQCIDLSYDPITKLNAHGHKKNHPRGLLNAHMHANKFDQQPSDTVCSMYPFTVFLDEAARCIGIDPDTLHIPENLSRAKEYIDLEFQQILDFCHKKEFDLVFVAQDPRVILYHQSVRSIDRHTSTTGMSLADTQKVFFKDSIQHWEDLNLTDVWDIREQMALSMRPMENVTPEINLTMPHHWVNCIDLWTRTEEVMKCILDYVGLPITQERWQQWLPICANWQKLQLDILKFCYNQPHIVDAIVNNWYYEIDLSFQQEAIIQHYLIYQHGLNLKTWQLAKFPSNTQDLHKLLEPNIHPIPVVY